MRTILPVKLTTYDLYLNEISVPSCLRKADLEKKETSFYEIGSLDPCRFIFEDGVLDCVIILSDGVEYYSPLGIKEIENIVYNTYLRSMQLSTGACLN